MESSCVTQLLHEIRFRGGWKHGDSIFPSLAASQPNFHAFKIQILHSQLKHSSSRSPDPYIRTATVRETPFMSPRSERTSASPNLIRLLPLLNGLLLLLNLLTAPPRHAPQMAR